MKRHEEQCNASSNGAGTKHPLTRENDNMVLNKRAKSNPFTIDVVSSALQDSVMYPTMNNSSRLSKYHQFEGSYDFNTLTYPVALKDIGRFCTVNNALSMYMESLMVKKMETYL